jgi:hypothetical protein
LENGFIGPTFFDWNYSLAMLIGGYLEWSANESGLIWGVDVYQASFSGSWLVSYIGDKADGDEGGG